MFIMLFNKNPDTAKPIILKHNIPYKKKKKKKKKKKNNTP